MDSEFSGAQTPRRTNVALAARTAKFLCFLRAQTRVGTHRYLDGQYTVRFIPGLAQHRCTHTTLPTSATIPHTHALTSSLTICTLCRTHSALLRARRGQRPTDHNGPCCTNLICMQLTTSLIKITTNILPPNLELVIMGQRHTPSHPPSSRRTDACSTDGFLASLEL